MPVELLGGRACLDFANTVAPRLGSEHVDHLPAYAELLDWERYAGLLSEAQHAHLASLAKADPSGAESVHRAAYELRDAIYQAFAGEPSAEALAVIHDAYVAALGRAHLGGEPLGWQWPEHGPLSQVMWPVAASAADLAVSGDLARVKTCPGDDGQCGWLFLDTTKSGTRRWCTMRTCGSRVKSRRQVARLRAARQES